MKITWKKTRTQAKALKYLEDDTTDEILMGGGAGGGSMLVKAINANLGENNIIATGGPGGEGLQDVADGGDGGLGRIHIDYNSSYTGTTNPTLSVRQDSSIKFGGSHIQLIF